MLKEDKNEIVFMPKMFGFRPWSRHSLVLLIAGASYFVIGVVYFSVTPHSPLWEGLIVARAWMPLDHWSFVWMSVGLSTMISSRWPPSTDKWGYMLLTGLSSGWGGFYITGVIFEGTPAANLSGGVVWWLIAFMWWAISGLSNPIKVVVIDSGSD